MQPSFRVYTNRDVVGCESAGALKNVMALAAGMAHGLGYGDNSTAALINRIEWTRKGLQDVEARFRDDADFRDVVQAGEALHQALVDLEMRLFDLRLSGGTAGQDTIRWPRQLFAKLTSLAGYISGSDFPPTTQQLEVHQRLQDMLRDAERRMGEIRDQELTRLNELLTEKGVPNVIGGGL